MAVNHPDWVGTVPQVAKVIKLPTELTEDSDVDIAWLDQERAPKKLMWKRGLIFLLSLAIRQSMLKKYSYMTLN